MDKGIRTMKEWFEPALKSGLLEIRVHRFNQDQVASMLPSANPD